MSSRLGMGALCVLVVVRESGESPTMAHAHAHWSAGTCLNFVRRLTSTALMGCFR